MSSIPVTILNGFLGSGKTTLLRNILGQSQEKDLAPSVVVNDMSELDIDGVLVANTQVMDQDLGNFVTISGDSISTPDGIQKLDRALMSLAESKAPPWIIIETSGSTHPLPLIQYFSQSQHFGLKGVITLVDATWMRDDYDCGRQLIPKWQGNLQGQKRGIENLLAEQILFSNQVLLTKTDRLPAAQVKTIGESLHPINPYASIVATAWGKVSAPQIKQMPSYNFQLVQGLIQELKDEVDKPLHIAGKDGQRLVAKVIHDDRPFHPARLWHTCQNHLTHGVFRSKGLFWMPSRDTMSLLWNQANGSIGLEIVGFWRVSIFDDPAEKFTDEQRAIFQKKIDDVESRFGDRRCRLTVIGQEGEVDAFVESLNQCFLTDEELDQWEQGIEFDDPWPQKVAKISTSAETSLFLSILEHRTVKD